MKKLTMSIAAALVAGLFVTAPAQAGCTPVHDPGSPCPFQFSMWFINDLPGVEAVLKGKFHEGTATTNTLFAYVKDTGDDGLDAYVWVRYEVYKNGGGGKVVETPIASASGVGVSKPIEWTSPAEDRIDQFWARVCVGPGETKCTPWKS